MKIIFQISIFLFFSTQALACVPSENEVAKPEFFVAGIEGFLGPSYRVELVNDDLVYSFNSRTFTSSEGTTKELVKPSDKAWAKFYSILQQANFWQWNNEYNNMNTHDGTLWAFEIRFNNCSKKVTGFNAYPDQSDFNLVRSGIEMLLLGGRDFK